MTDDGHTDKDGAMSLETPNAFADEENILLHTALFKQVSPSEAEELLPYLKHAAYDKGDYIFSEIGRASCRERVLRLV